MITPENFTFSCTCKKLFLVLLFFFTAPSIAIADQPANDIHLTKVILQLSWKHQFQFAGFYAAIEQGYFAAQGLDVEIREYQQSSDPVTEVTSGQADFGISSDELYFDRMEGKPVVILANYFKRFPLVFLAKPGLKTLADLQGKSIMLTPDRQKSIIIRSAFRRAGLIPGKNIDFVPHSFDISSFARGEVDAYGAFISNEPFLLDQQNIPYEIIKLTETLPGLGDINLFTSTILAQQHPERNIAFVAAANDGWRYALEHPAETVDLILQKYSPEADRQALLDEAEKTRQLIMPEHYPIGSLDKERIRSVVQAFLTTHEGYHFNHFDKMFQNQTPFDWKATGETQKQNAISLTNTERIWLNDHPIIRVSVPDLPPYHFWDNEAKGISVELLTIIMDKLGIETQYIRDSRTAHTIDMIFTPNPDTDLLLTAQHTKENESRMAFSSDYLNFPCVLFTRRDSDPVVGLEDLIDKTVITVKNCPVHEKILTIYPNIQLTTVNTVPEALAAVRDNRADAFAGNLGISQYHIARMGLKTLKLAAPTGFVEKSAFAVRKDWYPLATILDKGLNMITPQERSQIMGNYFTEELAHDVCFTEFWQRMQHLGIAPVNEPIPFSFTAFIERHLIGVMITLALLILHLIGITTYFYSISRKLKQEVRRRIHAEDVLNKEHRNTRFWLETLMHHSPDIICFKDGSGRWLDANPADLKLFQLEGVDYKGKTDSELAELAHPLYKEALLGCEVSDQETWEKGEAIRSIEIIPTPDGMSIPFDVIKLPLFDDHHSPSGLLVIGRDITEHIATQDALQKINNSYQLSNKVRHALIHCNTISQLLENICWLIVEHVGYSLTWIGRKVMDENNSIQPVSMAGSRIDYIKNLDVTWDDRKQGQGPAGKSIKSGEVVLVQDIMTDPDFLPWRDKATTMGFKAVIGLPIRVNEEIWGTLVIYATCATPFSTDEIELLKTLTEDIGFGIASLQVQQQRCEVMEQLSESREHLTLALEASNLGTWDWQPQENILTTNEIYLSMLGYPDDNSFPKTFERWSALVHPDDRKVTVKILRRFLAGEDGYFRAEFRMLSADGQWKWILHVGRVMTRNAQGKAKRFMGVNIDISEQKYIELLLVKAQQKAEAGNMAKSQFLANMSHELRTPLNAILGFSQLLSEDDSLHPEQHKKILAINNSGSYLLDLINDVLDFSKIEAARLVIQKEQFNLHKLLKDLSEMFQFRIGMEDIQFSIELSDQVPCRINTDRKKMRQVLINLLGNAIKFTDKGSVTLLVWLDPGNTTESPFTHLHFEVKDTGHGISTQEMKLLFQPFVQGSEGIRKDQGTGLGLSISRSIAHLLGGDISVSSELSKGSVFHFHLPVEVIHQQAAIQEDRHVIGLTPGEPQFRILACDSHEESLELMKNWLLKAGLSHRTAVNTEELIEIWQQWQPHLIWMDMHMPSEDRDAAIHTIKTSNTSNTSTPQNAHKPIVIALSTNTSQQKKELLAKIGYDDFVTKPCNAQIFNNIIRKHLGISYLQKTEVDATLLKNTSRLQSLQKPAAIKSLPPELQKQLWKAVTIGDSDMLNETMKAITQHDNSLADVLQRLVDNYEYERILQLLK